VNDLLTRLWRLGKPLQWRFLWPVHAKFICGITGVVHADDGRVLLLRHRLWPADRQWGFPTGYANKGERHEDTIAREVREETASFGCGTGIVDRWPHPSGYNDPSSSDSPRRRLGADMRAGRGRTVSAAAC
jgi:hypothetical protein